MIRGDGDDLEIHHQAQQPADNGKYGNRVECYRNRVVVNTQVAGDNGLRGVSEGRGERKLNTFVPSWKSQTVGILTARQKI